MSATDTASLLERLPARPEAVYRGEPHTDDWHLTRQAGLGGSDVAAALGLDRYRTPWEVYTQKVSPPREQRESASEFSEPASWGRRLEPIVAQWAADTVEARLLPWPTILRDARRPWMLASLDGLLDSDALRVLECKVTGWDDDWRDGDMPQRVEAQARWYLAITGLDECIVAALLRGTRGELRYVRRDDRLERLIVGEAERFWQRVERHEPPEPGPSERVSRLLNRRPAVEGQTCDLSEAWRARLDELRLIEAEVTDLERERDTIKNALRAELAEATSGYLDGEEVCTYRPQVTRRLDTKGLAAEAPELVDRHRVATTSRVLRIKGEAA